MVIIVNHLEERSGIHIVFSKIAQTPVGLHSLQQTIVVIRGAVRGTNLGTRDSTTQKGSINLVRSSSQTLVKGKDDQSAISVEIRVREQRSQKVTRPSSSCGERTVVAIIGYKVTFISPSSKVFCNGNTYSC